MSETVRSDYTGDAACTETAGQGRFPPLVALSSGSPSESQEGSFGAGNKFTGLTFHDGLAHRRVLCNHIPEENVSGKWEPVPRGWRVAVQASEDAQRESRGRDTAGSDLSDDHCHVLSPSVFSISEVSMSFKKDGQAYARFRCRALSSGPVDLHFFSYFCRVTRGPLTEAKWGAFLKRKGDREISHPNNQHTGKGRAWDNHSAGLKLVPREKNPRGKKGWKCIKK